MEQLEPGLNIVGVVLAIGFLVVIAITWSNDTKVAGAVKATLAFLLVAVNVMLGNQLLIILWSVVMVLSLIVLTLKK